MTHEEIKRALFQMHPDKSPGPDGFSAGFFQNNWDIVAQDTCEAVKSFFLSSKLLKEVNHTFVINS